MERIIGTKFHSIHRCVDMLCLNLGKTIKIVDGVKKPEYSFHIQTQWRFVKNERILLASRDIYIPHNQKLSEVEWDYDEMGRPDEESSIFDVLQKNFAENFSEAVVCEVAVNKLGDLKIVFSNGIYFETFTPSMRQDEFLRFLAFDPEDDNKTQQIGVFDWRIKGGKEKYLSGLNLYKVAFPEFWKKAYTEKNKFYEHILQDALNLVKHFPDRKDYLAGEKIQHLWHAHCDFCWETVTTDSKSEFYCTKDLRYWICPTCFNDFRNKFKWAIKSAEDWEGEK